MSLTLYDLGAEGQVLREAIATSYDPETGEELEDTQMLYDRLAAVEMEIERKSLYLGALYKEINAEAKAVAEEQKSLARRARSLSNHADRINAYLVACIPRGEKYKDQRVTIGWRKNPPKVQLLVPEEDVPDEWCRIERFAKKTEIKKAIDSGQSLPFAEIVQSERLDIR